MPRRSRTRADSIWMGASAGGWGRNAPGRLGTTDALPLSWILGSCCRCQFYPVECRASGGPGSPQPRSHQRSWQCRHATNGKRVLPRRAQRREFEWHAWLVSLCPSSAVRGTGGFGRSRRPCEPGSWPPSCPSAGRSSISVFSGVSRSRLLRCTRGRLRPPPCGWLGSKKPARPASSPNPIQGVDKEKCPNHPRAPPRKLSCAGDTFPSRPSLLRSSSDIIASAPQCLADTPETRAAWRDGS